MNFFKNLFIRKSTLTIYMKSGNVIVLPKVSNAATFMYAGDEIRSVKDWRQFSHKHRLLLGTLNLSQIEAVTVSKATLF